MPWPMLFMLRMPGPVSLQGRHPPGPRRRSSLASVPSRTRSGLAVASYLSRWHASASNACFRGHGCVRGLGSRGNACRAHPRRYRPQAPFAEGWRTRMAYLSRNRNRNHRSSRMMTRRLIRRRPSVGGRCSTLLTSSFLVPHCPPRLHSIGQIFDCSGYERREGGGWPAAELGSGFG